MCAGRVREPTREELEAALARLAAAAPGIWPKDLRDLGETARRIVRARAQQAIHQAESRARELVPLRCQSPDGSWRTRWVAGERTDQLVLPLDKDPN